MDIQDLFVTPVFLLAIFASAYALRRRVTDEVTRRYFIPALTLKIIGALTLGLIYFYYYQGGDTVSYHTYGSRIVWEAFMESPLTGIQLLFADGSSQLGIYKYSSRILFFTDPSSYNVVKVSAIFDILTFATYSSTALLFAVGSFIGSWLLFLTFYKRYPTLHKWIALACFFIPSVFFWGSGLMKDTIAMTSMCFATYGVAEVFIERRPKMGSILLLLLGIFGMYAVKVYILLTFLPAAIVWISLTMMNRMKSATLKFISFPFILAITVSLAYLAALKTGEGNDKYSLEKLGETARITAYDIRYYTGRNAGSGYELGELDGSFGSMVRLAPQAINVTLFRPYLWEVKSIFMLLSALESMGLFLFTAYVLVKRNVSIFKKVFTPDIFFCMVFSISFAFAVGVSTFNFGTLVRYKIPLMPLYFIGILLVLFQTKREKKVDELDATE